MKEEGGGTGSGPGLDLTCLFRTVSILEYDDDDDGVISKILLIHSLRRRQIPRMCVARRIDRATRPRLSCITCDAGFVKGPSCVAHSGNVSRQDLSFLS